jgi:hypothetical protein
VVIPAFKGFGGEAFSQDGIPPTDSMRQQWDEHPSERSATREEPDDDYEVGRCLMLEGNITRQPNYYSPAQMIDEGSPERTP